MSVTSSPQTTSAKASTRKSVVSAKMFDTLYARLNDAQKEAVDTIEGPVAVVAGPGTGKTQVLALRTANILRRTQMRPNNILCLTFSKSGATAMRQRLLSIIGPDAYAVTINTIHGFCNDVITANPTVFEEWSAFSQISDLDRYREVNKIIDSLSPDLALVHPKAPHARTRDLLSRISQLKREGITDPQVLEGIAAEYDEQMQTKSKEGTKAHTRNLLAARKFRELLTVFHRYQDMLQDSGRYDYDDMILTVLAALKEEEWLLSSLQVRYQYVLVDEFQDTNGAQCQCIETLTQDPTGSNAPNLFVVGDDDQAIYRFQGANLTNILSFRDRFPEAPVIALSTSYRSSQPILDAANVLIGHNTERLVGRIDGLQKILKAGAEVEEVQPNLVLSASDATEHWMIADMIQERIEAGKDPSEIAVLVQTNRELVPLYDVLQARDIPVVLSGKLDLLEHSAVAEAVAILKAVDQLQESSLLGDAMSCSCFGCHPADLATLFKARREQELSLLDVLLLLDQEEREALSLRDPQALLKARDTLLDLHNKTAIRTITETVERTYHATGLLAQYTKGDIDLLDFAALQEFFGRVSERATEKTGYTLSALLDDLSYYHNPDYGDVRLTYDLPHLTEVGVQLMTAHKSKGLEFETVILSNVREGHWDRRRNPARVAVPEDLLFGLEKETKAYEQNQDERRVFFVAMTRAKSELILTCPAALTTGDSMKAVSPSSFAAEAGVESGEIREVQDPTTMSTLLSTQERSFDAEFEAFLRARLETFALSPTALQHFIDDPESFLELDLLMRPQAKSVHYSYGNAVHHVLAKWALSLQNSPILTKEQLLTLFEDHLRTKEILTTDECDRLLHLGTNALSRYYDERLQSPYPFVHKVEFGISTPISDYRKKDVLIPLKGKLDRIDLLEEHSSAAVITDFKTGKPKAPAQIEQYGYHRQLVFYALLLEHGYGMLEPKEFVLDFIGEEAEAPVARRYQITTEEKDDLRTLISVVWEKIQNLDFTPIN